MTKPRLLNHWIIAGIVCLVLLCLSTLALAQDNQPDESKLQKKGPEASQTSDPPSEEISLNYEKIKADKKTEKPTGRTYTGNPAKPERAGGYLKIGDIKGESEPASSGQTPKHNPEWTDAKTGDPGTAADQNHTDWIPVESISQGVTRAKTGKMSIATKPEGYECPDNDPECYCHGVLDCKKLWLSGECKENSEWEDSNDPSKGGCIQK